jgi:START domain
MTHKIAIVSLLFVVLFSLPGFGQSPWKLHSDRDGIQVYTQDVTGSPFKALKAVCTVETSLSRLAAVLLDVKNTKDWVYATKECKLLKQTSPSELYYYSELSLPWPASNRDFIIRISIAQDPASKVVMVTAENKPDYIPGKKSIVRIRESAAYWQITPLAGGMVKVEYTMQVDPAGMLPAWLVNMFVAKGPTQTFIQLRKQVKKPFYNNIQLGFIKD